MDVIMQNKEEQLIEYLRNILKYQVAPKGITELRNLVKDAPKKLKLWNYIEENLPTEKEFSELLEKFPQYFSFNPDRTITITGPNYCTLPHSNSSAVSEKPCDDVDGISRQSDLESDSDSSEDYFSSEMHKCQIDEKSLDYEKQLIEYVQNFLKYQFSPMNISMLRILVKDTLKNKPQLSQYFETHCPTDDKFCEFFKEYPCFNFDVHGNMTVAGSCYSTVSESSSANTLPETYDEVDSFKTREEYESDPESDCEIVSS
ncbi:uncharacterized protein LOC129220749 [Uloborus diversus]|uniref:uncharacterized protein LOC129220749 n=1 Tax=Uloborus diversus TaxID=327109 RepID=UPI00240A7D81|nr:uncharacterized protein LOC129220749 [Uloborus diversus]